MAAPVGSSDIPSHTHHIIPVAYFRHVLKIKDCRRLGCLDMSEDNLVELSVGQHLLAHYYLMKSARHCIKNAMERAFACMYNTSDISAITEADVLARIHEIEAEYRRIKDNECISVDQYTLDGKFVKTHTSISAANIAAGSTSVSQAVKTGCVCKGYIWVPAGMDVSEINFPGESYKRKNLIKPVSQYDFCGNLINTYASIHDAMRETGIRDSSIQQNVAGKLFSVGGYIFVEAGTDMSSFKFPGPDYIQRGTPYEINQYDYDGNLLNTYKSISSASAETGVNYGSILQNLNGASITAGGYVFAKSDTNMSDIQFPGNGYSKCHAKTVLQYGLDGYLIHIWSNLKKAQEAGVGQASRIGAACKDPNKVYNNCLWRYHTIGSIPNKIRVNVPQLSTNFSQPTAKSILQYALDGTFIAEHKSIAHASRALRGTLKYRTIIQQCIKGICKTGHGFVWLLKGARIKKSMFPGLNYNKRHKSIIQCSLTGKHLHVFSSIDEAAKKFGGSRSMISCCLMGKYKTAYGYKWKYAKVA